MKFLHNLSGPAPITGPLFFERIFMKRNFNTVYIDTETQANTNLTKKGQELYFADPSFRIYLLGYAINGGPVKIVRYPDRDFNSLPADLKKALSEKTVRICAANAAFDHGAMTKWFAPGGKFIHIQDYRFWTDTAARSRAIGVPGRLDKASKFFGRDGKDAEGSKLLEKYFARVEIPDNDLKRLEQYLIVDVEELRALDAVLPELDPVNASINALVFRQNQKGIRIDRKNLKALDELAGTAVRRIEEGSKKYGYYQKDKKLIVTSSDQVKKWIASKYGITLPTVAQKDLEDWLALVGQETLYKVWAALETGVPFWQWAPAQTDEFFAAADNEKTTLEQLFKLAKAKKKGKFKDFQKRYEEAKNLIFELPADAWELIRLHRARQAKGLSKLANLLDLAEMQKGEPRITSYQIFHGAHTGRPAGRGVNLHNVTRYAYGDDDKPISKIIAEIKSPSANLEETPKRIGSLLWSALLPDAKSDVVIRSDLSAIEPRVGAWLRNDRRILAIYEDADAGRGKDEYTIFGDAMGFSKEISRPLSKITILAACYGMQSDRLRAQCRQYGVPDPGDREATRILSAYHLKNPSVRKAWFKLIELAVDCIGSKRSVSYNSGRLKFDFETYGNKPFLIVTLPSGRRKGYADVMLQRTKNGYQTFSYINLQTGFRETMRAPMFYENMVQMSASDVLYTKVIEIERSVPARCLHTIYDEGIFSALVKRVKAINAIMKAPVDFMPGMPVNSKTTVSKTFHKGDAA